MSDRVKRRTALAAIGTGLSGAGFLTRVGSASRKGQARGRGAIRSEVNRLITEHGEPSLVGQYVASNEQLITEAGLESDKFDEFRDRDFEYAQVGVIEFGDGNTAELLTGLRGQNVTTVLKDTEAEYESPPGRFEAAKSSGIRN